MKNVFLATAAILSLLSCTEKQKQPNIIFILADDMGYGDVSYFDNNSKLKTENLDRMAQEGVVFTDAHSSSSVSTPTRYGILTGRYNWRSTLKNNVLYGYDKALIPADRETMASMLRKNGYTTEVSVNGIWGGIGTISMPERTKWTSVSRCKTDRLPVASIISTAFAVPWTWLHTSTLRMICLHRFRIGKR